MRNSRRRRRSVQVSKLFMVGNMLYFQTNCFIFKPKILKEATFLESLLILLEIRFVWNNGGQKHSLSIDVRCPFNRCLRSPPYPSHRLPDYFASASTCLSKFMYNYLVIVVSGYWAICSDTGQHRSSAKIIILKRKQRQKS